MSWSIRIGRAFGTDVRLHITFLLFLAWIGLSDYRAGGAAAAGAGVLFVVLIFGCVLLHEFGHALAARRYGIPTPDIVLLPIGGVARLARMPEEPRQEFVIAVAGPAVNVAIAVIAWVIIGGSSGMGDVLALDAPHRMLSRLLTINVWLVLFNLIPAFPMDGGRMLRAALAIRFSYVRSTQIAAMIGKALAVVFGIIGMFGNPMLILIALFVFQGAAAEVAEARAREARHIPLSAALLTDLHVLRIDANLAEALDSLLRATAEVFPVAGPNGVEGIVSQRDLVDALQRFGPGESIRQFVKTEVPAVSHKMPLDQMLMLMQQRSSAAVLVASEDGRMMGLVTPESIAQALASTRTSTV